MEFQTTRVSDVERPGAGYALLRFGGETPIVGEPGQFVMIRGAWGAHPVLPRAFSLVEAGDRGAVLVREVGEGTRLLAAMRPGDPLTVLGPLGTSFRDPEGGRRPVLVAGGVGVAPLVFLAERLARRGARPLFLYGARTASELVLRDRIERAGELAVTTEDGSAGEAGLVTAPLARVLRDDPAAAIYSCGPHRMLEAVADAAREAGAPCQVALESPMACGMGTCKGCAVIAPDGGFRYVCTDGPVFDSAAVFGGRR